jgi:hypothetical protein
LRKERSVDGVPNDCSTFLFDARHKFLLFLFSGTWQINAAIRDSLGFRVAIPFGAFVRQRER